MKPRHPGGRLKIRFRRRSAGSFALGILLLGLAQGCAHTLQVQPSDYARVPGHGSAEIATRDGRVYDFHHVTIDDSSRFVGRIDVIRDLLGSDGHLDPLETTEQVRIPFDQITSVTLHRRDALGTLLLAGAGAGLIAVLVRAFQPTPESGGTVTPPPPRPPTSPGRGAR